MIAISVSSDPIVELRSSTLFQPLAVLLQILQGFATAQLNVSVDDRLHCL
jgi:hypothetical protein